MTTTRDLCGAPSAALQVRGVEKYAARLVRDGYLPRAGDEDDSSSTTSAARRLLGDKQTSISGGWMSACSHKRK